MLRRILRVLIWAVSVASITVAPRPAWSAEERAWAQEVTGAVAVLNDNVALRLLPALLGVTTSDDLGVVSVPPDRLPDLPRVASECERLAADASTLRSLTTGAPPTMNVAELGVAALHDEWVGFTRRCAGAARAGNHPELESLAPSLDRLAALTTAVGLALPDGVACPARLKATVETCRHS